MHQRGGEVQFDEFSLHNKLVVFAFISAGLVYNPTGRVRVNRGAPLVPRLARAVAAQGYEATRLGGFLVNLTRSVNIACGRNPVQDAELRRVVGQIACVHCAFTFNPAAFVLSSIALGGFDRRQERARRAIEAERVDEAILMAREQTTRYFRVHERASATIVQSAIEEAVAWVRLEITRNQAAEQVDDTLFGVPVFDPHVPYHGGGVPPPRPAAGPVHGVVPIHEALRQVQASHNELLHVFEADFIRQLEHGE